MARARVELPKISVMVFLVYRYIIYHSILYIEWMSMGFRKKAHGYQTYSWKCEIPELNGGL